MNHSRAHDLLSAYLEHDLGDAERAAMDAHLAACATCAGDLADLRSTVDLLRRLPDPEPPPFLATRVMARIRAGESRPPLWRRWLEQLGAPLVAAPLATAAAALLVFSFAAPPSGTRVALVDPPPGPALDIVAQPTGPTLDIVAQPTGPVPSKPSPATRRSADPVLIARHLRGASHPHSTALAGHFDNPVLAVAFQSR